MGDFSWSAPTFVQSLPPLPSLAALITSGPPSDPANEMLEMIRAIGGCYQLPGERWIVPLLDGGIRRFPDPVGHRLVTEGHICRHPMDLPGTALRFVRFIPRERMPEGFVFSIRPEKYETHSKIRDVTAEEIVAKEEAREAERIQRVAQAQLNRAQRNAKSRAERAEARQHQVQAEVKERQPAKEALRAAQKEAQKAKLAKEREKVEEARMALLVAEMQDRAERKRQKHLAWVAEKTAERRAGA